MQRFVPSLLTFAVVLTGARFAHADVVPPDVTACQGKSLGNACSAPDNAGTCQSAKCAKLDYANWNRDAMSSPPTVEYACTRCVAGGTPNDTSKPDDDGACAFGLARRAGPFALAAIPAVVLALLGRRRRDR